MHADKKIVTCINMIFKKEKCSLLNKNLQVYKCRLPVAGKESNKKQKSQHLGSEELFGTDAIDINDTFEADVWHKHRSGLSRSAHDVTTYSTPARRGIHDRFPDTQLEQDVSLQLQLGGWVASYSVRPRTIYEYICVSQIQMML